MDIRDHLFDQLGEQPLLQEWWEPSGTAVVVGYSQNVNKEVHVERCRQDGVAVLRRRGGGGAVLLLPGVLCWTIAFTSTQSESPYYFFKKINAYLAEQLQHLGVNGVQPAGISDLAIDGKKILGCSMYKSRQRFLYQGSLLINADPHPITRYLQHPSKEPDYRQGRDHGEFITSLFALGYHLKAGELAEKWNSAGEQSLQELLF
jgi:lipoate---protein ligase